MTIKLTAHRHFWIVLFVFLTACGKQPATLPTDVPVSTAISSPVPLPTLTPIPITVTPSPLPTQPVIPFITPNPIQLERWKEYQTELAMVLFSYDPEHPEGYDPEAYKDAICEWDILGQSGQEVYVWAECVSSSGIGHPMNPAIIYLKPDGSIREVNVARAGTDPRTQLAIYDLHLFPIDVQEKFCLYYFYMTPQCSNITPDYVLFPYLQPRLGVLLSHLEFRKSHAKEPPLVVLSATPAIFPTP